MKKTISLKGNDLVVSYPFSDNHLKTLVTIFANDGCAAFENRAPNVGDLDGFELSWEHCDELVEMGLLDEDEESYDIFYEITDDGKEIVMNFQ